MFTQVRSANRRVSPVEDHKHKSIMKVVYVVLEPQYQNALTEAAKSLNSLNWSQGPEKARDIGDEGNKILDPSKFL